MKGHVNAILIVCFSPDSTKIVTGGMDNLVIIWDAKTGSLIGEPFKGHSDRITSICFSSDGTKLATSSF